MGKKERKHKPPAVIEPTFKDLPKSLHARVHGKKAVPKLLASLPANYDPQAEHPLFGFLGGGMGWLLGVYIANIALPRPFSPARLPSRRERAEALPAVSLVTNLPESGLFGATTVDRNLL